MPRRIQLSRKKGYRKPIDTINVARPTKWGNPINWQQFSRPDLTEADKKAIAVRDFEEWLNYGTWNYPNRQWILDHIHELAGKDLACWCKPDEPCHADVLIRLANE